MRAQSNQPATFPPRDPELPELRGSVMPSERHRLPDPPPLDAVELGEAAQ